MSGFSSLVVASFKQFFRDKTAVFFLLAFPLMFMIIFGFVFSGDNNVNYYIGLVNNDDSGIGEVIAETIGQMTIFNIDNGELKEELEKLRHGDLSAVVAIPSDIQSTINRGETADITVYYDPAHTTSSQIILSVMRELVNQVNRQVTQEPTVITLKQESIQAKSLRDIDYLVPGILGMSVLFLGLFGAVPMVEWREKQVLKRFSATPLSRFTVVSSQVTYRLALALLQTGIIVGVAYSIFGVQVVGSWPLLIGLVILGTLVFVSLGYFAVSRARTVEGAMPVIQLIQFPMLFLSGIFFPVDFMPDFLRPIVAALPLTYLGDALRQVMVDSTPLYALPIDIIVLVSWLIVSMVLAIKLFRWE